MTFWVAGAVVAGGVISAVGSNLAAGTQAAGQEQAANTQEGMFNTINSQEQPFIQGGYGAENSLNYLLGTQAPSSPSQGVYPAGTFQSGPLNGLIPGLGGNLSGMMGTQQQAQPPPVSPSIAALGQGELSQSFTPADYLENQDPGYQFQLQTGAQALRNADTPGVGALSGPALKDLISFNQNMASTGYQNAFNRFQTQQNAVFGRLSALAGLGQNAASNTGAAGATLGTGIAQAQAAAAGSQAAGIVGGANALGGSANSLAGLMYLQNNNSNPGLTSQDYGLLGSGSVPATGSTIPAGGGYLYSVGGGS